MFENINKFSPKQETNIEKEIGEEENRVKNLLEKESSMSIGLSDKARKILRMMVTVSALTLLPATVGTGIYEMFRLESNAIERMEAVHNGSGVILEKTYHKAVNPGFDNPYYSLKLEINGKIIEAQVNESIYKNVTQNEHVSFQYHDRGSTGGPEIIINSLQ